MEEKKRFAKRKENQKSPQDQEKKFSQKPNTQFRKEPPKVVPKVVNKKVVNKSQNDFSQKTKVDPSSKNIKTKFKIMIKRIFS